MVSRTGLVRSLKCGVDSVWAGLEFIALTHGRHRRKRTWRRSYQAVHKSHCESRWEEQGIIGGTHWPFSENPRKKERHWSQSQGQGWSAWAREERCLETVESGTWKEKDPGCRQSPDNYIGQGWKTFVSRRTAWNLCWRQVEENVWGRSGLNDCDN